MTRHLPYENISKISSYIILFNNCNFTLHLQVTVSKTLQIPAIGSIFLLKHNTIARKKKSNK